LKANSKLKKEGIQIIEKLDTQKVNKIAINVASKLCLAFPEHNFNRSELFESISRLSMFIAKMPQDSSGAKFILNNNSIYFNENLSLDEMSKLAVHECIHFIQHSRNTENYSNIGLYNTSSTIGTALNEAAVQLMASEANFEASSSETYFGISLNTISPDYYPLECTLVEEITYFTGTYPLYHSALYGNDIFKNTFTLKIGKNAYKTIISNLDKILNLENNLNCYINELQYANKVNAIRELNNIINKLKKEITKIFYKTQNIIIEKCFKNEFNSVRNIKDLSEFTKKLYNFKNIMGYSDDYTFYNEFYRQMMNYVQEKKTYIEQYGEINLFESINQSLMIVDNTKNAFSFIGKFISKVKKLIPFAQTQRKYN